MIVSSQFSGDNNGTLMDVQHAAYWAMVVRLFTGPRDRYLSAAALLRADDRLSRQLRSMDGFDHRTLQLAHDRIAALFRFAHDDGGQLQLGETEADYRQRLADSWREFFQSQVERLTADDEFTRAICTATAFGNKEPGVAAEHWLDRFLRDSYGEQGLIFSLVGEICGSPIRSNGRPQLGSRSPRTRCVIARLQLFLFVASCLSN